MSLIVAKGQKAKENANKTNIDLKKVYLRLKDNQSHKVRLLGTEDYVQYKAHGAFELGIYNQPCVAPAGKECPLCVAYEKGGEKFKSLAPKNRYVFVFGSLERAGEFVAIDVSKGQAKKLISDIEEYASVVEDGDVIGFILKRTGEKADTSYSLNPIIKMTADDKKAFAKLDGKSVELDFFEQVLQPRSPELQAKILKELGFDVETHLPHINISDDEGTPVEDAKAIDLNEDDEDLLSHI